VKQSPVHVLVIFDPAAPQLERVALAAAVGAIQARGEIRLRRLAEIAARPDPEKSDPERYDDDGSHALQRIRRDYVLPRAADLEWADALVLVSEAGSNWSDVTGQLVNAGVKTGVILSDSDPAARLRLALTRSNVAVLAIPGHVESPTRRALVAGRWLVLSATHPVPFEAAVSLFGPEHLVE